MRSQFTDGLPTQWLMCFPARRMARFECRVGHFVFFLLHFTFIVPENPCVGGVKHKRGSQIQGGPKNGATLIF